MKEYYIGMSQKPARPTPPIRSRVCDWQLLTTFQQDAVLRYLHGYCTLDELTPVEKTFIRRHHE